jgi:glycosyltransferase involved in cell wall biosynthesis
MAEGLKRVGFDVRVITAYPHYPGWRIFAGYSGRTTSEISNSVPVTRLRPYMPRHLSNYKRLRFEIDFGVKAIFARWGKPDAVVLISPALFATAIAQFKARLSRRRPAVVVWVQDIYGLGVTETGALGSRGARLMRFVERYVLRRADAVVVIHDRFKKALVTSTGIDPTRVHVIRNWTHLQPFSSDRSRFRTKFGWGEETVVLHAGNQGAKQALENVVEAARLADGQEAAVRFVLLGNGNQRDHLATLAGGVARIDFMDSLDVGDFQGAMAAADILLVNEKPGVSDMAVPSKLTSYFSAKRPVLVATDAASISAEEVERAGAGVRVNAGDPQALLNEAITLGADVALSDRYGRAGATFQREALSEDRAVQLFVELLVSLQNEPARITN